MLRDKRIGLGVTGGIVVAVWPAGVSTLAAFGRCAIDGGSPMLASVLPAGKNASTTMSESYSL